METWSQVSGATLYAACFGLAIVSALVPWVNGEALMLSFALCAPTRLALVGLVVLASVGQMVGKCILYWCGRGSLRIETGRAAVLAASWKQRLAASPSRAAGLVFISSALGIPPFYVITLLAGALHLRFGRFVGIGLCGRVVRFGLLVLIPRLTLDLWGR